MENEAKAMKSDACSSFVPKRNKIDKYFSTEFIQEFGTILIITLAGNQYFGGLYGISKDVWKEGNAGNKDLRK